MKTSPFRQRRFPPAEVRRIIRRAAALADKDPATPDAEQSLSQDELEAISVSLGLPVSALRAAIADPPSSSEPDGVSPDASHRRLLEEVIDGEVPPDRHEDLVEAIQAATGDPGRLQVVGKTVTWTPTPATSGQQSNLVVTVRSRDGATRVRVEENLKPYFQATYYGLGFGLGLSGAITGVTLGAALNAFLIGTSAAVLCVVVSLLLAQVIYGAMARRHGRKARQIMERLRDATAAIAQPVGASARGRGRARVALKAGAKASARAGADAGAGTGVGTGAGTGAGADTDTGAGADAETEADTEAEAEAEAEAQADAEAAAQAGAPRRPPG